VSARALIEKLKLTPHPEGGWYREVFRSPVQVSTPRGPRSAITTIYYLLEQGQLSRWHVVSSDEIWHFYGGSPLELLSYEPAKRALERTTLTEGVHAIEAGMWQAARSLGEYSFVGCSVGPGFDFADFRFVSALPEHAPHFTGAMASLTGLL
jgi:uncharacterized protein